jgi:hypothetical protein
LIIRQAIASWLAGAEEVIMIASPDVEDAQSERILSAPAGDTGHTQLARDCGHASGMKQRPNNLGEGGGQGVTPG